MAENDRPDRESGSEESGGAPQPSSIPAPIPFERSSDEDEEQHWVVTKVDPETEEKPR